MESAGRSGPPATRKKARLEDASRASRSRCVQCLSWVRRTDEPACRAERRPRRNRTRPASSQESLPGPRVWRSLSLRGSFPSCGHTKNRIALQAGSAWPRVSTPNGIKKSPITKNKKRYPCAAESGKGSGKRKRARAAFRRILFGQPQGIDGKICSAKSEEEQANKKPGERSWPNIKDLAKCESDEHGHHTEKET